jgi:hypothetical protein
MPSSIQVSRETTCVAPLRPILVVVTAMGLVGVTVALLLYLPHGQSRSTAVAHDSTGDRIRAVLWRPQSEDLSKLPQATLYVGDVPYLMTPSDTDWPLPSNLYANLSMPKVSQVISPRSTLLLSGPGAQVIVGVQRLDPDGAGPRRMLPMQGSRALLPDSPGRYILHVTGRWNEGYVDFAIELDVASERSV